MSLNNPPAFPRPASEFTAGGTCPDGNYAESAHDGMTLRDWFAGQALRGALAREPAWSAGVDLAPAFAKTAYRVADAMLAERAKVQP